MPLLNNSKYYKCVCCAVESVCLAYMMDNIDTHHGLPRAVRRENIYMDVLKMYQENMEEILGEFPFRVKYENVKAIDTGGVCRDMFSSFWEEAYLQHFDGERLLVPSVRPGIDMSKFKLLGTTLAHGFMCGFLPVRIAFPVIAAVVLGPDIKIPDTILIESFVDFLASHESAILLDAIVHVQTNQSLTSSMKLKLGNLLSRFGCTEMPICLKISEVKNWCFTALFYGEDYLALCIV